MTSRSALISVLGLAVAAVALGATPSRATTQQAEAMAKASCAGAALAAVAEPGRGVLAKAEKIEAFKTLLAELGKVPKDCTFKGKRLQGKVQVVTSFPDFKVQKVSSFPDLKVQWVTSFPSDCGKWQKVTSFPDFKIQWVTSFPDFKIQEVTSFPGVP